MEKKKWLWKRKPSERSPGETESSGSLSSFSERLSEELSPETTSKLSEMEDEAIKSLTTKLSAALANVAAREEMVKKHSKVAEEAVAGWEKAENEALELKKQLTNSVQRKLALEDRVSHLDEALKECVRQLRQAREEQGRVAGVERLGCLEEENAFLKRELESRSEELQVKTIERDLSSQAAETASKQHLEGIKKLAKLELECRNLKYTLGKGVCRPDNDTCTIGRSSSTVKIDFMEDFIEMEKLAALEDEGKPFDEKHLMAEIGRLVNHTTELEARVRVLESEKFELEEKLVQAEITKDEMMILNKDLSSKKKSRDELQSQLEETESECTARGEKIKELEELLLLAESSLTETEILREKLDAAATARRELESQMVEIRAESESKTEEINALEQQTHALSQKVISLTTEVEQERAFSMDLAVKYEQLNEAAEANQSQKPIRDEAVTAGKLAECQKTILSLGNQLKSLATIEDLIIDTPTIKFTPTSPKGNDDASRDSDKNRKKFTSFFARSKNGTQIEI